MTMLDRLQGKKQVALLVGALFFLLLRWQALVDLVWVNAGMIDLSHYPVWQAILPDATKPPVHNLPRAIQTNSDNVALRRGWGMVDLATGNEAAAVNKWQAAGLDPAKVAVSQGRYGIVLGDEDIALAWFRFAVELDPRLASIWHELGLLYQADQQTEAALAAYDQALALGYGASADPLAKLLRDSGDNEAAIHVWRSALDSFSSHPERLRWWHGIVNSLRAEEQWSSSSQVAQIALNEFPEDSRLHVELGYALYHDDKDVDEALRAMQLAIALDSEMAFAYAAVGDIMVAENRYSEAVNWYTKAIDRDSSNRSWYITRAIAARASGNIQQSLQLFQEVIELYPNWAFAYYQIALAYHLNGNPEEAVEAIERALSLVDSSNSQYLVRAGIIYQSQGRTERAVASFERAVLIDPDNGVALQRLQQLEKD